MAAWCFKKAYPGPDSSPLLAGGSEGTRKAGNRGREDNAVDPVAKRIRCTGVAVVR